MILLLRVASRWHLQGPAGSPGFSNIGYEGVDRYPPYSVVVKLLHIDRIFSIETQKLNILEK